MRLICPNCEAQYEVDDSAIPDNGRDVQCSNCAHAWYQMPTGLADARKSAAPVEPPDTRPPPKPRPRPTPPPAPASDLDPAIAGILREEADLEIGARRSETPDLIDGQPELAFGPGAAPASVPDADPAPQGNLDEIQPPSRRDLLPDIEEINSSLRAQGDRVGGSDAFLSPEEQEEKVQRGRGFRLGFSVVLLVCASLVLGYAYSDAIKETVPALSGPIESYVAKTDTVRLWVDQSMRGASATLSDLLSGYKD